MQHLDEIFSTWSDWDPVLITLHAHAALRQDVHGSLLEEKQKGYNPSAEILLVDPSAHLLPPKDCMSHEFRSPNSEVFYLDDPNSHQLVLSSSSSPSLQVCFWSSSPSLKMVSFISNSHLWRHPSDSIPFACRNCAANVGDIIHFAGTKSHNDHNSIQKQSFHMYLILVGHFNPSCWASKSHPRNKNIWNHMEIMKSIEIAYRHSVSCRPNLFPILLDSHLLAQTILVMSEFKVLSSSTIVKGQRNFQRVSKIFSSNTIHWIQCMLTKLLCLFCINNIFAGI